MRVTTRLISGRGEQLCCHRSHCLWRQGPTVPLPLCSSLQIESRPMARLQAIPQATNRIPELLHKPWNRERTVTTRQPTVKLWCSNSTRTDFTGQYSNMYTVWSFEYVLCPLKLTVRVLPIYYIKYSKCIGIGATRIAADHCSVCGAADRFPVWSCPR